MIFLCQGILKKQIICSLFGLCCVTHPLAIRNSNLFESKYGIYEVKNQISSLNIRNNVDAMKLSNLLENWWKSFY